MIEHQAEEAPGDPIVRPAQGVSVRSIAIAGPAVLLLAALFPELRSLAWLPLVLGWVTLRVLRHPAAIAWAATLPVAVALAWPAIGGGDTPLGPACTDPLSPIVLRRLGLAAAVLAVVATLAVAHGSSFAELGLGRPRSRDVAIALAGCLALVVGGLAIGPAVARPFFGELDFPVPPAALVPAALFGVANGVTEELQYRGAMQGWLGRLAPSRAAIGYPALVFGIVHAGPEVIALLPVHVALLAAVGAAGGVIRARTGSLAIPIGVHVGADIALYVGLACRAVPT